MTVKFVGIAQRQACYGSGEAGGGRARLLRQVRRQRLRQLDASGRRQRHAITEASSGVWFQGGWIRLQISDIFFSGVFFFLTQSVTA
ncbi:hypothetical protein BASA62_010150 [Batrachochytrium salamandrivorans]|nr:hypothetical protein BASA62_010150 [Batrachochytrium salamandrivorans]